MPLRLPTLIAAVATAVIAAPAVAAAPPAVTVQDRVLGRADAPVTVIEYASFTCSHCADFHNDVLPALKARYIDTGKARLVFRNLPTAPANVAAAAAAVGLCAAPGRFFDVAASFMTTQAQLKTTGTQPWFAAAVAASGRTADEIDACLKDPATRTALDAQIDGAEAAGVAGTPAFFVNGVRIGTPTLEGLSAAIDAQVR